jgi:guanylate kinase
MKANDELIEFSHGYDDYKGVPKAQIRKALESGYDVILRLDVQGAEKIKKLYPDAILVFLTPANEEEWLQRLGGRRLSQEKDFETRIATVKDELIKARNFDYIVVNAQNQLQKTIGIIEAIITAEHQKSKPRKISI